MKKVSALYEVSKDLLTAQDMEKLRKDLIIESRENKLYFAEKKIINLLYDRGDYIAVPRAYGLRYFGEPLEADLAYGDSFEINFKGTLRDEQPRVVETVLRSARYPNGLISMPCGSGKTICALKIISELKKRALILVHKEFLLDQWRDRILEFTNLGPDDIGLIQGNKCEYSKPISIGMVQSISKKEYDANAYTAFGVIVCDETHRMAAPVFRLCLDKFNAVSRLGLSATLTRGDGLEKVFKYHLGEIITSAFGQKLTPEVWIFKYNAELPRRYYIGDKTNMPAAITDLTLLDKRNSLILKVLVQAIDKQRKILVLSDRLAHIDNLFEGIKLARPNATVGKYIGGMKSEDRYASSQCRVILGSYGISREGLDIPDLDTLMLASPRGGLQQSIGRILRELPCKKTPIVIDIADNSLQLGELKLLSDNRRKFYERNKYLIREY